MLPQMKSRAILLTFFFALAAIEGLIALAALFQDPSMERNAVLFGFSAFRLAIGGAITLVILLFGWLTIRSALSQSWTKSLIVVLDRRLLQEGRLLVAIAVLVYWIAIIALVLLTFKDSPGASSGKPGRRSTSA